MPSISRRHYLSALATIPLSGVAGCQQNSCPPADPGTATWPQYRRGSRNTNAAAEQPTLNSPDSYWATDLGDSTDVSAVSATGNTVLVAGESSEMDPGIISTPGLSAGERGTSHALSRAPTGQPALVNSLAVTPVLGSYDDPATGGVVAISLDSWTESWTHELDGRPNPPTHADDAVVVSSDAGEVSLLESSSGDATWTRRFGDTRQDGAIPASPAVDETRVYVTVSGSAAQGLYALDRESGDTVWAIPGPDIPNPPVRTGGVVLGSYREHELAAFDAETGESQWSQAMHGGRVFPPAVGADRIFSADEETVYALGLDGGETDWEADVSVAGAPLVVGDCVFVPIQDGLVGLAASDGAQRWRVSLSPDTACVPVEGGFLFGEGSSVTLQTDADC